MLLHCLSDNLSDLKYYMIHKLSDHNVLYLFCTLCLYYRMYEFIYLFIYLYSFYYNVIHNYLYV